MRDYKVTFHGYNETQTLTIASERDILACEIDDIDGIVNGVIDTAIELGYLVFGADFRDRLDTYLISCEPA